MHPFPPNPSNMYKITIHLLFLRRTSFLQPGRALDIAFQLVARLIMPRVHLILNRISEREFPTLNLFSRGREIGLREAHRLEECYRCELLVFTLITNLTRGDIQSFHSRSFRRESQFNSVAIISMTLGSASNAACAFKNARRVLRAMTSTAV